MNRLWVRLTLAFALVIAVTLIAVGLLGIPRSATAFRRYLALSDPQPQASLLQELTAYFADNRSWTGIGAVLRHGTTDDSLPNMGRSPAFQPQDGLLQVTLADPQNNVVYQRFGQMEQRQLSPEEQLVAQDIVLDGVVVGRLVVTVPEMTGRLGPLEERFLTNLRDLLLRGAILAGALGIVLGLLVSHSLSTPLRRLASAARSVAQRDFARKVPVDGTTEVAELAQAFNDMTDALQSAEEQRQQLVADVAHELRTPLTILQGNLRAILDGVYPLNHEEISRLYGETRLLARLVDDLRVLALADAGQLPMKLTACDLKELIRRIASSAQAAVEPEGLSISTDIPDDLPLAMADADRVAQVLHNLLANAIRHTSPGGLVRLSATSGPRAVEVTVADTGEGIAPEHLAHIFDRFWRADPARSRDNDWGGGTGLGLSIAQSLVRAMGGRIWAESEPGRGAVFRFTLPTVES